MKKLFTLKVTLVNLALVLWATAAFAQTISTGVVTPSSICAGSTASVAFSTTGTFPDPTTFSVELSDQTGAFTTPTVIGTGTTTPITVTIPAAATAGSAYKIRIVSATPAVTGSESAAVTLKAKPAKPREDVVSTYCENNSTITLFVAGSDIKWYQAQNNQLLPGAPTIDLSSGSYGLPSAQYYATQTIDGCESDKTFFTTVIRKKSTTPIITQPSNLCQFAQAPSNYLTSTISGYDLTYYFSGSGLPSSSTPPTISTASAGTIEYSVVHDESMKCQSDAAKIFVTIDPAPATPTATNVSYSVGDTPAALTATGTSLKWYTTATGGTGATTAPTPTATAAGTQDFWVTQTVGACESARAQITVTVSACTPPAAPTVANVSYTVGDTPAALTATGTALKWYAAATGGTGATTAPTPTATAAGTQNFWVTQTVGACESPRAQITVTVSACTPPAAPTVANVSYTVGDTPAALTATGTALKWYTTATGGTGATTAPTPTATAAGTQNFWVTQTVGACESARAQITVTVSACTPPAAPTVANLSYTVGDSPAALTATGTSLKWYAAATGGTGATTAPTPTTTAAGTQSFWVTQTVGACESARVQITVTVSACTPPAAPTVANVSYTVGDSPAALTATGTSLKWYTAATGGTGATTAPTPTATAVGTQNFWVTQTVGACESARALITVTVSACTPPAAPTVANISYTVGDTPAALTATGTALKWYAAATGGTGATTAPTPTTTAAGTQSFWVTQTVGACESARALITVTVSLCVPPSAPVVSNATYCKDATTVALTATGTGLKWYAAATGGTGSATAPVPASTTVGTKSYYVSQTVGSCESARAKIDVIIKETAAPVVVTPVTYCLNELATALSATGTTLKWYSTATSTTSTSTAPIPTTTATGNKSYFVTQTANGCESEKAEIVVTTKAISATPTSAMPVVTLCQNETASALTAVGTGLKWYTAATGGTALAAAPVPVTTSATTTSYYVSQTTTGACESLRLKIDVVVKDTPLTPVVTQPAELCVGAAATPLSGAAFNWYTSATGTTPLAAAPTPSTTAAGTTDYYASQKNTYTVGTSTLVCESPRAKISVVVNPTPALATVVAEEFCQEKVDKSYAFAATGAAGNSIAWYAAATGGTALSAIPTVNLKTAGDATFYAVQVSNKNCESPTRVAKKITVKPLPALPVLSKELFEYCQFIKAEPLVATPQTGAALNWYGTNATGGTATVTAPTPSTEVGGTISYYVGQTLNGCVGDRAKIDVKVNTTPKPSTTTSLAYCQGEAAPILDAQGYALKWYRTTTGEWQGFPFTPFTEKVEDYSFYVTQTGQANGCESPKEEIKIHIKAKPSATISGTSTIPFGGTANISLAFTSDGPWTYTLSDSTKGTATSANISIPVKPSVTTTYLVTGVSNACGAGIPLGFAVVNVLVPNITTGNPSVAEVCAGKTFQILYQKSGDFPSDSKFVVQISTKTDTDSFYSIPSAVSGSSIIASVPDTTYGGSYYVRVTSENPNPTFTRPGTISAIPLRINAIAGAMLTGTQTIIVGETAKLSVALTGNGPWEFYLNDGTKDSLVKATVSPMVLNITPSKTTTYTIREVSNACGAAAGKGSARVQVDPVLGIEPVLTNWVKVYPTIIENQCLVEFSGSIAEGGATLELIDPSGIVHQKKSTQAQFNEMDFSGLSSGIYLIRIQNGQLSKVQRVFKP